ncbi:hypothetical protein JOY44_27645 (plasmid) [Phormidium sp. CLA17]|uniref:hypothetical protein n=1 Tax=Leptolyngbya sp. Cla-17 TaxID=2803751 RepID=UPI00149129CD|nr:hypothetical protein [Leptolyngbya sp. Cla-17]MBM0745249.1 hypothetical protein [Leptolyngbya sp. Cla-17]
MSNDSDTIRPTVVTSALGDRIRNLTSQLRQERDVQIKATSRILGAAAQIAVNHDRLIDQVVEMVEDDLDQQTQLKPSAPRTGEQLKQQFKSLKDAKAHFNLKANSWDALAAKLNEASIDSSPKAANAQDSMVQRLAAIEQEIQLLRGDMNQVLNLLSLLVEKLP